MKQPKKAMTVPPTALSLYCSLSLPEHRLSKGHSPLITELVRVFQRNRTMKIHIKRL